MKKMNKSLREYQLLFVIFKEGDKYIAECPILDIATSGKSANLAKKRFGEMVELFFDELEEMGTLEEVLLEMGWTKVESRQVPAPYWKPPKVNFQNFKVKLPCFA